MSEKINKASTIDISSFKKNIGTNGYSKETTEIIMDSWKNNTKNKYNSYLKQWEYFVKMKTLTQLLP